jgi:XTP/dITP diphosphohydrolase
MQELLIATANSGKLGELRALLAGLPVRLSSLADHFNPLPLIPETGTTFLENALQKALWVRQRMPGPWILADDSGLEVDALGGRPGVLSARFAGEGAGTAENNRLLLETLSSVTGPERTARFKCTVILLTSASKWYSAGGTCEGSIALASRGTEGFGYDPLFIPKGFSRTFGEMAAAEKHPLSHRGIALQKMSKIIRDLIADEESGSSRLRGSAAGADPTSAEEAPKSDLSHALNNPLCAITGFSSALLSRLRSGEEIEKSELTSYLQVIYDAAFRCRDIVEGRGPVGMQDRHDHTGDGSAA